ncbi:MAG: UbiD family decarboxylase [Chitinophagales bacterium]|nr:UbiD family decarboxylase [Chitinophagales bacterium]
MGYVSLKDCIEDLEKTGQLVRISEEVDPYLEMAAIHLRVYSKKGPAILFEKVKGTHFAAVSNLFGTTERSHFLFRDTFHAVQEMIALKSDPVKVIKNPLKYLRTAIQATKALPKKVNSHNFIEINVSDLPQVQCWPMDGGAFVTLPLVYSEDPDKPGVMASNLGMYRIQLSGNQYIQNKEVGLHYQLHRGIGVHQTKWNQLDKPMKVSIFVGGPPSLTFSAVMPLPEGISELTFAGALGNRRFRYTYEDGYCLATDADFIITGEVFPHDNKPEGPFGDHLGYYSLVHDFPVLKVHKVFAKKDAIWPFTVVGRPPQEDTSFGALIHEIAGGAISTEIPGVKAVHAVDAAGVHPLLFAIGSERYTPYYKEKFPQEILTQANHILGSGQLSLAKYLFIADGSESPDLDIHEPQAFLQHVLERIDWERDVHFHTKTSIDTLDYSGTGLNTGSKVVFACSGVPLRELGTDIGQQSLTKARKIKVCLPGILAIETKPFEDYEKEEAFINEICHEISTKIVDYERFPLLVICDDADFLAYHMNNFIWVTFTRSNPSHDIYGVGSFIKYKHWGCQGPLIIDARAKPHHAPLLELDETVEKRVDYLVEKYFSNLK